MQADLSRDLIRTCVNTLRMLSVDAVEKANSGHPGMPMGAADCAFLLWNQHLRYSASDPHWPDRDRFILSAGHGSMLLYSLLYLSGYDISFDELKNFRQWGSKTPGHPEYGRTPGVETTTGPLGQGIANAVGMAIAAKMLSARFNREDFSPISHRIYVIAGDGDMMEGVASEAASFAGHLKLNNLIVIYDDNRITIDGSTEITFSEDVAQRFGSYGWATQRMDGHNHSEIETALAKAKNWTGGPSLILARTHIGYGSPNKADSAKAHGSPLGKAEVEATKKAFHWPIEPTFLVPEEVRSLFQKRTLDVETERKEWERKFASWRDKHPDLAKLWDAHQKSELSNDLFQRLTADLPAMPEATRSISGKIQQKVAALYPGLVQGSADLVESTKTEIIGSPYVTSASFEGRNIAYGVREHAMGSVMNGLALSGGFIPIGSTFLIFSDYMRPPIRLAALSKLQTIYVFTHDSVFLGEDGPTHQPIEQLATLRMIPNLALVRPADAEECAAAWVFALSRKSGPTALALSRQKLLEIHRDGEFEPEEILKGGYIAWGRKFEKPDLVVIATGSELHLAMGAAKELSIVGKKVRVVSMPCAEVFDAQTIQYRNQILPRDIPTASIEAGRTSYWTKYIGPEGLAIGVDHFGESAPDKVLAEKLGFTVPQITDQLEIWLRSRR